MITLLHIILGLATVTFITFRILKKPYEIAIYALLLSSTLPSIVEGKALAYGQKHFFIRFEYIIPLIGLFLIFKGIKAYKLLGNSLERLALFCMLLHAASIPIAIYWGVPFGIGVIVRLLETFLYFFIIVKLTKRKHIPRLVDAFIFIGTAVSFFMLLMVLTGNPFLYKLINSQDMSLTRISEIQGQIFGARVGWLRYSIHSIPVIGAMSFYLLLEKSRRRAFYGLSFIIIILYSITCGQRTTAFGILAGMLFALFFVSKYGKVRVKNSAIISVVMLIVMFIFIFSTSELFSSRLDLLIYRTQSKTMDQVLWEEKAQQMGNLIAIEKLNESGTIAWMMGFSGFKHLRILGASRGYDISSPMQMIYRFGIIGLGIMLLFLFLALKQGFKMAKKIIMTPEEAAVIFGVILFILIWVPGSFIRGAVFAYSFNTLSWFIILLAWMQVIYRGKALPPKINKIPDCGYGRSHCVAYNKSLKLNSVA